MAPFRFLGEMLGIAVVPAFARRDNMLAFSDNAGGWVIQLRQCFPARDGAGVDPVATRARCCMTHSEGAMPYW